MANQWLLAAVSTNLVPAGVTNRHGLSGVGAGASGEAARNTYFSGSYTLHHLFVRVTASTISAGAGTVRTRKNLANGAQSVSITGTGTYEDTTNSDTFAATDTGCIQLEGATTGSFTPGLISTILESTANVPVLTQTASSQLFTANVTEYPQIIGGLGKNATEAEAQLTARMAGTLSNLRSYLGTNPTATVTLRVRKNTANGNEVVSWLSGVTGTVADASGTDAFVAGDLINYAVTNASATNTANINEIQTDLNTTATWLGIATNAAITQAEPLTRYYAFNGLMASATTEADVQLKVRGLFAARNLFVRITANGVAASTTITLRKGAADTALTVSVGNAATGTFEDTTHTVGLVAADLINMAVVTPATGGTPTITLGYIAVEMVQSSATVTPAMLVTTTSLMAATAGVAVTPSMLTLSAATTTASARAGATIAPSMLTETVTLRQPTVTTTTGATVTPGMLTVSLSQPATAASGGATLSPDALLATLSLTATTESVGAAVSPSMLTAAVSLQTNTASGGVVRSPSMLAEALSLSATTETAGALVAPAKLVTTLTLQSATASAGGSVTILPAMLSLAVTLPAATASAGALLAPSMLALATSTQAPAESAGATLAPAKLATTLSLPAATTSAGATRSPAALLTTLSLSTATVTAVRAVNVTPSMLALNVSQLDSTPSIGVTVTPAMLALTVAANAASASAGVGVSPAALAVAIGLSAVALEAGASAAPSMLGVTTSILTSVVTVTIPATRAVGLDEAYGIAAAADAAYSGAGGSDAVLVGAAGSDSEV